MTTDDYYEYVETRTTNNNETVITGDKIDDFIKDNLLD